MSDTLRSGLIRLAFHNPDLRADLLPLIEKEAAGKKQDKVRAVNEKGTVVWVNKDTLRKQPGKFKPYKHEEDTGKGGGAESKSEGKKDEGGSKAKSPVPVKMYEYIGPDAVAIGKSIKDGVSLPPKKSQSVLGVLERAIEGVKSGKDSADPTVLKHYKSLAKHLKGEVDKRNKALAKHPQSVRDIANEHDLPAVDVGEVAAQAKSLADKNAKSRKSPEQRKQEFLKNIDPSKYSPKELAAMKERIKKMSAGDFEKMVFALAEDEGGAEGGGKTASLRAGLIRLAFHNPELRPTLLPLIEKHAEDAVLAQAKKAVEGLARLVAAKVGGTVGSVDGRTGDGYTSAAAEVVVPNLPSIFSGGDDDAAIEVRLGASSEGVGIYFWYVRPQPRLKWLADEVAKLSVRGNDIEDAVQKAAKPAQALPAVLEPMREREALRRKSSVAFKRAVPEMKERLQKALIQFGFTEPVKVWGHPVGPSGTFTTEDGIPYAAESIIIEGLVPEDERRAGQRSKEVLANTRKVLVKALSRFSSNGVAAKLSSKPAYISAYTYNTTVILYFKDAPVGNMKLAGDEGDMAAVLDAEADPTSHDQNLPEHYYFGKTAEERLENIEKMLSQFASPKSKDQNKPQSYYGLPPKGKQASVGRTAMDFPSEEALKQYLRDHPNADRKKHKVRKDTTYEKHHAKVESAVTDKFNDVTSHLSDAGLSEDEAFGDREMSALGQKWFSVTRVKLNEAKKSADREKLNAVEKELSDIAGKMKARITELGENKKGKQASVKSASRPLGPGVHLIEDLSVLGPNFRLVFRELGGDFLGSEQVPGYYLDLGGILKLVYKTPKMSPAGEAQAKKIIAKLLAMMKAGSTKTAGGSGAANAEYLRGAPPALKNKILQAVAKHYGTTTSAIMSELTDPDAEAVFEYIGNDAALQMQVYRDFKSKGFRAASVKTAGGIPVTVKKNITLKDGTVIGAGTRGTLRFNEQSPRQAIVDFDTRPNTKLGVANLFDYFGRPFMKVPSMSTLSRMADGLSKSVTGKTVEPDGYGPDGSPSWLLILGMV